MNSPDMSPEARKARANELRRALYTTAERSGLTQDELAPAVNLAPSDFSKAISPIKSEQAEQRRRFPACEIGNFLLISNVLIYLETLLRQLGYNPDLLHTIKLATKTKEQLLEEISHTLDARGKEDQAIREQLKLLVQEGGKVRKR
jgi:hypothetical protein